MTELDSLSLWKDLKGSSRYLEKYPLNTARNPGIYIASRAVKNICKLSSKQHNIQKGTFTNKFNVRVFSQILDILFFSKLKALCNRGSYYNHFLVL